MQKMSGWKGLAVLICAFGLLASCGLKGDLYLPEGRVATVKLA